MEPMNRGFTIIELLVTLAIFIVMTSFTVAKFGNFNQSTLLTDTAYDIALVVRLAQTYGLSVKNSSQIGAQNFNLPYGVDFDMSGDSCGGATSNPTLLTLFADLNQTGQSAGMCDASDQSVNTYVITRGAKISSLCIGADATACHQSSNSVSRLDVSFQRPNPEAVICASNGGAPTCNYAYSVAMIQGTDGSTRTIVVRQNGQISVQH